VCCSDVSRRRFDAHSPLTRPRTKIFARFQRRQYEKGGDEDCVKELSVGRGGGRVMMNAHPTTSTALRSAERRPRATAVTPGGWAPLRRRLLPEPGHSASRRSATCGEIVFSNRFIILKHEGSFKISWRVHSCTKQA
jgi:hypothetical protein